MKLLNRIIIYSLMLLAISCSSTKLRDISPRDYEFNNEFVQSKWEYFLNLTDCQKVNFVDSVYTIIPYNYYNKYLDSNFIADKGLDTNLYYYHNNKLENFYYWIFREIEIITRSKLSIPVTLSGFNGLINRQSTPGYMSRNALEKFKYDVNRWKDSLGCE